MVSAEHIVFPVVIVFSLALITLAVLAYHRNKNIRMLFLAIFFSLFFVKGLLISLNLFMDIFSTSWLLLTGGILDAVALLTVYISTLKA